MMFGSVVFTAVYLVLLVYRLVCFVIIWIEKYGHTKKSAIDFCAIA